jgi:hypothetical protein
MKLIREFETLSWRERIAVGTFSTVLGGTLTVAMNMSFGLSLETSIQQLSLTVGVNLLFVACYSICQRLGVLKKFETLR